MGVFSLGAFYALTLSDTNFSISKLFIVLFIGIFVVSPLIIPGFRNGFARESYRILLALCWLSGLFCGAFLACHSDSNLFSMMLGAISGPMSIVATFCTASIPFLISFFVVYISRHELLFPVCFLKAFLFSFAFASYSYAFGTAGWLFSVLILFSDLVTVPMLYCYWSRYIYESHAFSASAATVLLSLTFLTGSICHRFIMPLFAHLIEI